MTDEGDGAQPDDADVLRDRYVDAAHGDGERLIAAKLLLDGIEDRAITIDEYVIVQVLERVIHSLIPPVPPHPVGLVDDVPQSNGMFVNGGSSA